MPAAPANPQCFSSTFAIARAYWARSSSGIDAYNVIRAVTATAPRPRPSSRLRSARAGGPNFFSHRRQPRSESKRSTPAGPSPRLAAHGPAQPIGSGPLDTCHRYEAVVSTTIPTVKCQPQPALVTPANLNGKDPALQRQELGSRWRARRQRRLFLVCKAEQNHGRPSATCSTWLSCFRCTGIRHLGPPGLPLRHLRKKIAAGFIGACNDRSRQAT